MKKINKGIGSLRGKPQLYRVIREKASSGLIAVVSIHARRYIYQSINRANTKYVVRAVPMYIYIYRAIYKI